VKYKKEIDMDINIKYHDDELKRIEEIPQGDWIDLRSAEYVELEPFSFKAISLGVSMELPAGYEAHVVPRSSTFKYFGVIQTNGMGIIDESYRGDNDVWFMPVFSMRKTIIEKNDKICQFRIVKKMEKYPELNLVEKEYLGNENRGGHGSTGIK